MGIIGFGRIGQEVARMGLGLGMKVIASDPFIQEAKINISNVFYPQSSVQVDVATSTQDEVLQNADILTLHVPFSGDKPVIGAAELHKMKDGALLINTSRGGVVDELALTDALNSGKLAAAGLDVYVNEPQPSKAILQHAKISLSPHTGAETQEAQENIGIELAEKICTFFAGQAV